MRTLRLIVLPIGILLAICSSNIFADEKDELLRKNVTNVMVDILCSTNVISDWDALAKRFIPIFESEGLRGEEEKRRAEERMDTELHDIWLAQKYDMSGHSDVMRFLKIIINAPMNYQFKFAQEWAAAARSKCPQVAFDDNATVSAAMTLISTVIY